MARWIVLAGITAYLVIGYFAIKNPNDGWGRRNVYAISATLQQRAEGALAKIGADSWASVFVDGQTAILSGVAPTDSDRQDTIDAVRAAEWSGGKWVGGITVVRNATTLAQAVTPYEWVAQLGERGRVRLSGYVPGQKHKRAIRAEAQRLFPQGIEDQMVVAQGAPTGPWTDTAIWAMAQLSRLSSGEARFKDKVVLIRGAAPNAAVQSDIQDAADTKIAKPYKGKTDIRATGAAFDAAAPSELSAAPATLTPTPTPAAPTATTLVPTPAAPAPSPPAVVATTTPPVTTPHAPASLPPPAVAPPPAAPQPTTPKPATPQPAVPPPTTPALTTTTPEKPEPTAQHDNGVDCQKMVDKLMANNTIAFAGGSAEIRSVAHEMLNHLAQSAATCPLKIRITGHTDTTATDTADPNLSQARADAVASYLLRRGVARKRISSTGAGTDQPVGDNATSVGQAKNRRIEITVTN